MPGGMRGNGGWRNGSYLFLAIDCFTGSLGEPNGGTVYFFGGVVVFGHVFTILAQGVLKKCRLFFLENQDFGFRDIIFQAFAEFLTPVFLFISWVRQFGFLLCCC